MGGVCTSESSLVSEAGLAEMRGEMVWDEGSEERVSGRSLHIRILVGLRGWTR